MKPKLSQILSPRYRVLSHVAFWVAYILFYVMTFGSFLEDGHVEALVRILAALPVRMLATYLTLYWLIPSFLYQRKYFSFTAWFLVLSLVFGYFDRWVLHWIYVPVFMPGYDYAAYPLTHLWKAVNQTFTIYAVLFAAVAIKLIKRIYQNEKAAEELAKEKLDAELKFLKAQIHPHFLFNTLNNLYALTLQNSPRSSEVVMKLSNLLDYMLYECNVPKVPLSKEIKQMHNYIGLQRIRYDDRLEVVFTSSGDVSDLRIPPLLILPFIENAFKHGVSQESSPAFISIDLSVRGELMVLKVENSKSPEKLVPDGYTKGIGLKNVRRRLELLYGDDYDLQIFNEEETYLVVLRLHLEKGKGTKEQSAVKRGIEVAE